MQGKTFLDIGCGSGLFSLAACLLGAEQVVAFDYDPDSVKASMDMRTRANIPPGKWQILQGSILDQEFLNTLDPADIVYAWGVLHHTGAMWQAIDNTVSKVKLGGILAIAIYNHVENYVGGSAMWWHIKRFYNHSPYIFRYLLEYAYVTSFILYRFLTLRNPFKVIRHYGGGDGEVWISGMMYATGWVAFLTNTQPLEKFSIIYIINLICNWNTLIPMMGMDVMNLPFVV